MASGAFEKLRDLDLSRDEVERLGEALKKEEFRRLLADYVEEVRNPDNRKLYEEEIAQLERERGVEVTFINPSPGYVIKTSVDGQRKCFINICGSERIRRPSSAPASRDGTRGLQWSLPHSSTPPREDLDNKGARCLVYDVVFHPDTLHLGRKNKSFRNMVSMTACDAVEANFEVILDRKNLKFPKLQYKGMPHAAVIRRPIEGHVQEEMSHDEKEFFDKIYAEADAASYKKKTKKCPRKTGGEDKSSYSTPKYVIKHRSHVDIQDCVEDKHSKIHAAVPKELIIEINLPMLRSSSDITLDVTEKTVQLTSEKPSKYKLNLTLPYRVNEENGNAKFDKDLKKLIITLPVKRKFSDYVRYDSGVESDQGSSTTPLSEEDPCDKLFSDSAYRTNFLQDDCNYEVPEFTCHLFDNTLAFTLNVKNVIESSIQRSIQSSSVHVKFKSVSASYYESWYAFYVRLPSQTIVEDSVQIEAWDNNLIVQIPFCDSDVEYYFYGLSERDARKKFLEEPRILNGVLQSPIPEEAETEPRGGVDADGDMSEEKETASRAINISTCYESSGDELSHSYSPSRGRESSLDEIVCSSLDSAIPEDGEISTSLKKTVRFNDVIMRQLYRSNSSILGQKKKNQRKARNKKRAQERRHSESEASEVEDKKDDAQDNGDNENNEASDTRDEEEEEEEEDEDEEKSDYISSDIFDMDMSF